MFNNKTIYLCGTMSNLKSYGAGWRKKMKKWLLERGVKSYDPCTEETKIHQNYDLTRTPKSKWELFPQPLQEEILKRDLDQIERSTLYTVCFFTKYSTGTVSELTFALYHKIPVYIVTTRRLVGWPYTVANADGNRVFRTFNDLQRFLTTKYKYRSKHRKIHK